MGWTVYSTYHVRCPEQRESKKASWRGPSLSCLLQATKEGEMACNLPALGLLRKVAGARVLSMEGGKNKPPTSSLSPSDHLPSGVLPRTGLGKGLASRRM